MSNETNDMHDVPVGGQPSTGAQPGGRSGAQSQPGNQSGTQSQPGSQTGFQAGGQPGAQSGYYTGPQAGSQSGAQYEAPQYETPQRKPSVLDQLFGWFRASGVMRGDDRWVGGVCSGIALRLGWSPTLVRALMIVFTLFFGFGAALYAFAWMLLPDARDGRILAEDLIAGRWDWGCFGSLILIACALLIVGPGWVATVVAAVALWAICQGNVRRSHGYGYGYGKQGPHGPYAPVPPHAGSANGTANGSANGRSGSIPPYTGPVNGSANANIPPYADPAAAFVPPYAGPTNAYESGPAAQVPPVGASASAGMSAGSPSFPVMSGPAPAAYAAPAPAPVPAAPRRARRKPAGPFLVMMVMGLALLSGAGTFLYISGSLNGSDALTMVSALTVWISAVCVAMGALLVILGARGRRSGGLIPLALVAGFVAACMIVSTAYVGYATGDVDLSHVGYADVSRSSADDSDDYHDLEESDGDDDMIAVQTRIDADALTGSLQTSGDSSAAVEPGTNYWVSDSSPQTYRRLETGVYFHGDDYMQGIANIDLTKYANWNYTGTEASTYKAGCPAGQINLSVTNARVFVTLPDGCPYAFGSGGFVYSVSDTMGGHDTVIRGNSVNYIDVFGLAGDGSYDGLMKLDSWSDDNYGWRDDAETGDNSFLINFRSGISGSVAVRYASESVLPDYTTTIDQATDGDLSDLETGTRRHYGVQSGKTTVPDVTGGPAVKNDMKESDHE